MSKEAAKEMKTEAEPDEIAPEEELKLPFPTAAVVRLMRANLDREKIIKKDVKVAMNKWLGRLCESVAKEMNKANYVTMARYDFERAIEIYEKVEKFNEEKQRILAHMEAIKKDIERLEKDLGKKQEEETAGF